MDDYGMGSGSLYAGPGWGMTLPPDAPKPADPEHAYVGSGPGYLFPKLLYAAPTGIDSISARYGPRLYAEMLTDPAVASSVNSLKMRVIAGGPKLRVPDAHKTPAWFRAPRSPSPLDGDAPERDLTPDQKDAVWALEFCERLTARVQGDVLPLCWQWMDAMVFGVKLAEPVFVLAEEGVDAGMQVWESVRVRPNWAWRFVVDRTFRVKGVLTWDATAGHYIAVSQGDPKTDKFVWHTWMGQDGDPRGTSQLRAAYNAWNLKIQAWPMYYRHLVRFGSPGIDGEMAPGDTADKPAFDPRTGAAIAGQMISASEHFKRNLQLYQAGGVIVHPSGSKVNVFEPKSDGEAFVMAMDLFDRQMKLAIEYQVRTSMESKHGSKADSETASDEKDVVARFARQSLAGPFRTLYRNALAVNKGIEFAEKFTPVVEFEDGEQHDRPSLWTAYASLKSAGAIGPSQEEECCAMVGLPIPDVQADAAAKDAEAQKALDRAAAMKPETPPGRGNSDTPPKGTQPK